MFSMQAEFIGSYTKLDQCPKDKKPEYAFIGRSNVGKSSLINYLTNRKKLAKVSGTPGKTQLLNFFLIDKSWYLVDLPGYGYAKVSKTQRREWGKMIRNYLQKRQNLFYVFLLIDSRIPPQKIDLDYIDWLGMSQIPFVLVFTKTERPSKTNSDVHMENFRAELSKSWAELPLIFETSANAKTGGEDILEFIHETNQQYKEALQKSK